MFDGIVENVGGQPNGSMFSTYQPLVVTRLGESSPLVMNAAYVALGNDISVSATIQVDQAITNTNNQVYFFVCQEGLHNQSNMVVDILDTEAFNLDTVGQSAVVSRDFTLAPGYSEEDLRVIVLVQNTNTKEILQATQATPDYAGSLTVDANPDGVNAPWRLQGPEGLDFTGSGDRTINLFFTGDYTLTFLEVPVWSLPADNPQTQTLTDGSHITFTGLYTDGPFTVLNTGPIADGGSGQGVALIDFDNDGDLDIHVVNNGTADQLLRNDGNLEFTDVASGLVADTGAGRSSAWADFNRDGNLDLFLGRNGEANLLLVGDGNGGFTPANCIGIDDIGPASSVSWIDYDQDGNLDLYVANQSQPNLLLHSLGDLGGGFFVFSGISGNPADGGNTQAANWIDLNGDQLPELYIVNSFSSNALLENTTLGFSDISGPSGIDDLTNGMGSAWGDFDNDGDFDLYLSNEGMADHIYENAGNFLFNQTLGQNHSDMGHGRGVVWADFNNDTNLDIYLVRNGEPDLFLLGNGQGDFSAVPVGPAEADGPGNTLACGDIDGDGDQDLFITRDGQSNVLLSNDLAANNNFLELDLTGNETQPDAIGAVVRLTAGDVIQMRRVCGGDGFLSMNATTVHFGLGSFTSVDEVQITWPDGVVQTLTNLPANQILAISEGQDPASPVDDSQNLPRVTRLEQAHPNPFNPSTTIGFALAQSGPTRLDVFTVDGRHVRSLVRDDLGAGHHEVVWTGADDSGRKVSSGTYFYRLRGADGSLQTGRMALVK